MQSRGAEERVDEKPAGRGKNEELLPTPKEESAQKGGVFKHDQGGGCFEGNLGSRSEKKDQKAMNFFSQ